MPNAAVAIVAPRTRVALPASSRGAWIRARGGVRSASRAASTSSRDPMGPERRAFALRPVSQRDALLTQGKDVRVVHMVRHARARTTWTRTA